MYNADISIDKPLEDILEDFGIARISEPSQHGQQDCKKYLALGSRLLDAGKHQECINLLENLLRAQGNTDAQKLLGKAYFYSKMYQRAVASFEPLKDHLVDSDDHKIIGYSYYFLGRFDAAIKAFESSLLTKEDWNSCKGAGLSFYAIHEYEKAVKYFLRSLKIKTNQESCKGLGFALLYSGNPIEAASTFKESILIFEDWSLYQGLASSLYLQNEYEDSVEAYKKSIALNENWLNSYGLAASLFFTNNYEGSLAAFEKSLKYKNSWKTHMGIGLSCAKLQRHDSAIASFKNALKECNGREIYQAIGDAYFENDRYQEAQKSYEAEISSFYMSGTHSLINSFLTISDLPAHIDTILKNKETNDIEWIPYTKAKIGWCMFLNSNFVDAITYFREIYDPRQYDITAYRKLVLETEPKTQIAKLITVSKNNRNSHDDVRSLNASGWLYFLEEKYLTSIEIFSRSLLIVKTHESLVGRGMAFYEVEQYENAFSDFKKSIEIKPPLKLLTVLVFYILRPKNTIKLV